MAIVSSAALVNPFSSVALRIAKAPLLRINRYHICSSVIYTYITKISIRDDVDELAELVLGVVVPEIRRC